MFTTLPKEIQIDMSLQYGLGLRANCKIYNIQNYCIPGILVLVNTKIKSKTSVKFLSMIEANNDNQYFVFGPLALLNHHCQATLGFSAEIPLNEVSDKLFETLSI